MNEIKLYENKQVRSIWDEEKEEWFFSVIDVVAILTESANPRDYWYRVKKECPTKKNPKCRQIVDS